MMAAGANKPKYTHYDLGQTLDRPRTSLLYSLDGSQSRSFPTNIVQCLQLDHVTGKHQPKRYRHRYVSGGLARTKCLYSQNVSGHRGCVNAINFSHDGEEFLVSGTAHIHTVYTTYMYIMCMCGYTIYMINQTSR